MRWPLQIRRVVGKSMVPALQPGRYIILTGWHRNLYSGDIVMVLHEGKEKVKRIQRIKDGKVYLLGDNEVASKDSRHFGWLEVRDVAAKKLFPR